MAPESQTAAFAAASGQEAGQRTWRGLCWGFAPTLQGVDGGIKVSKGEAGCGGSREVELLWNGAGMEFSPWKAPT